MKPIRFSKHALERYVARGCSRQEVVKAIREGIKETARENKLMSRLNVEFNNKWEGNFYAIKQVAPIFVEEQKEIVVITVYVFYF